MKTRVSDYLDRADLLCQLAEEAAELAAASSKMQRIIGGRNPSPVNHIYGWMHMLEEIADVHVCTGELLDMCDWEKVAHMREEKGKRWLERLEQKNGKCKQDR